MSRTHLKAAIIGGLIVFLWGMFSWMVFPWHQYSLKKFSNEWAVANVIKDNAPTDGIYVLPNTFSYNNATPSKEMSRGMEMMERGPFVFASVRPQGMGPMNLGPFVFALVLQIVGAFIATWMLLQTKLVFKKQVAFITLFGVSVAILGQLPNWNWWGFSGCYIATNILDIVIGWLLAGFCIAKVLKRAK